jgi:hypothetical protein
MERKIKVKVRELRLRQLEHDRKYFKRFERVKRRRIKE